MNTPSAGTAPKNVSGEQEASEWVQRMFARIAPRYDLLNHLLSFNVDKGWRRALLNELSPALQLPGGKVLDLCCGTGDVMLELQAHSKGEVLGADFCHPMLAGAREKLRKAKSVSLLVEADALRMPLADNSLDAIAIAFGFRNLANYQEGLRECRRMLKPGGSLAILEFSHPHTSLVRMAYAAYSRILLPVVGGLISGSREAYSYLPESIQKFPTPQRLRAMMDAEGFSHTRFRLLSGGIAALHLGCKRNGV